MPSLVEGGTEEIDFPSFSVSDRIVCQIYSVAQHLNFEHLQL